MDASHQLTTVTRLLEATNAHDLDGIVGCFAPGYRNETPAHPGRSFTGRDQVRRNWAAILAGVPDVQARMTATALDHDDLWAEWSMSGTRRDGAPHRMAGVIVFTVRAAAITAARFYLEPVEADSGTVDDAVGRASGALR
jgi:ketosteroid isomerase-like protein